MSTEATKRFAAFKGGENQKLDFCYVSRRSDSHL